MAKRKAESTGRLPKRRYEHKPHEALHDPDGSRPTSELRVTQETRERLMPERLALPIATLGLAVRATNLLEESGIYSIHDLLMVRDVASISYIGDGTKARIFDALESLGFYRKGRGPDGEAGFFPDYAPSDAQK